MEMWYRLPITAVLAVISALVYFFFYQWLNRRYQMSLRRRLLAELEVYSKEHQEREVALVLSIGEDVTESARQYLDGMGRNGIRMFNVHREHGFGDRTEDWISFLESVKKEVNQIRELGLQRIYVFIKGPVAMGTLIGATLLHGPEALIHHYTSGTYFPVASLSAATIRL